MSAERRAFWDTKAYKQPRGTHSSQLTGSRIFSRNDRIDSVITRDRQSSGRRSIACSNKPRLAVSLCASTEHRARVLLPILASPALPAAKGTTHALTTPGQVYLPAPALAPGATMGSATALTPRSQTPPAPRSDGSWTLIPSRVLQKLPSR